MDIRNAIPADADAIAAIYNHYILNTTISFEEEVVNGADMAARIADIQQAGLPWIVLEIGDAIVGYAYATKWRTRRAYRYAVESSVYLDKDRGGKRYGTALYAYLLEQLRQRGCHMVIGGVAQPNPASVALHEKFNFRKVALFSEVGFKFERWIDVAYWELRLQDADRAT